MLNIGKLCLDTDFNFRVIREEDNDIDLFIDIMEIVFLILE